MADRHNHLPGAHLVRNHYLTGLIIMNNRWHTSEHGLGRPLKKNNLWHDNQITEIGHTFLWRKETGILTQRGGKPLNLVRIFHGTLSGQSVPGNNHDHGMMGKQVLPAVYPHLGQWPQQGHQYPHNNQSQFIHNTRNRSYPPHTRTQQHRPTKSEPK